jgi:hypothetical protein
MLNLRYFQQNEVVDQYYSEQQETVVQAILIQQQMELEQLIQIAENLKNDIIKLHDQEQALIQRIKLMEQSRTSLFGNLYSLISNKNLLFFGRRKKIIEEEKKNSFSYSSLGLSHRFLCYSCNK